MHGPSKLLLSAFGLLAAAGTVLMWIRPASGSKVVVVYTSVDAEYAQPLAKRFTQASGIEVLLRTDSEAAKTTGLIERLRQLKANPDGDVWWNSERSGTLLLAREGVLAPYVSPQAAGIPSEFKDPRGFWSGFGLRARVLIFNTRRVKRTEAPRRLEALAEPKWRGRFCMARPLFGTTRSHLVALVLALGEKKGFALLRKLRGNGSAGGRKQWILPGNSTVRERVADGTYDLGLTDTDDVYAARDRHQPVDLIFLEQTREWPGVYLIPNTVSLIAGGPHPQAARQFIDFLLRPETEAWLARQGARQIPVRPSVPVPAGNPTRADLPAATVDVKKLGTAIEALSQRIDKLLRGVEP